MTVFVIPITPRAWEESLLSKRFRILWAPRADAFPHNRLGTTTTETSINLFATVTNKYGRSCAEPVNEQLPQSKSGAKTDIPLSITSECLSPQLLVALSDKDGNVLDQKEFNFESTTTPGVEPLKAVTLIIVIVVLLIIILIGFYLKKKNKMNNSNLEGSTPDKNNVVIGMLLLITLIGLTSFGFINKTLTVKADDGIGINERPSASLVTNIDKDAYFIGDKITATGTATLGICANTITTFKLYVNINGGFNYLIAEKSSDMDETIYGSRLIQVPDTTGTHTARFTLQVDSGSIEQTKTFTVLPRPTVDTYVNGKKSDTIPVSGSAEISWQATNATIGCTCTLSPGTGPNSNVTSCGSSPANETRGGPITITDIRQRTTASVKCTSSDYAPPSTTTTKVIGGLDPL